MLGRKWKQRRTVILLLVPVALVSAGCSGTAGKRGPDGDGTAPSGSAMVATRALSIEMLPKDRFALPTFGFDEFQSLLTQLAAKGVPVVVNVWASWCGPCREESPNLVEAARRHGAEVQFLGVDILDRRGAARAFIQEEGYPYPSVFDPAGEIRDRLGYIGQPVTIFYDARGRKVDEWSGPIGLSELLDRVAKILQAQPTS
jgi:cytochrome c biogenesis protein CcmG/thiol:disulfide interchange protein DsbE